MTADDQVATWLGLAPTLWGWIFAALFASLAVTSNACRPLRWLHDEYRYQPWSARGHYVAMALGVGLFLHIGGFFGAFNLYDDYLLIIDEPLVTHLSLQNLRLLAAGGYHGTHQDLMFITAALN